MSATSEQQAVEQAVRALRAMRVNDAKSAPKRHSQQTPQCPHAVRFAAVLKFGGTWSPEESAHLATGCDFCEKVRKMFVAAIAAPDEIPVAPQIAPGDETIRELKTATGDETISASNNATGEDTVTDNKPKKKGAPGGGVIPSLSHEDTVSSNDVEARAKKKGTSGEHPKPT